QESALFLLRPAAGNRRTVLQTWKVKAGEKELAQKVRLLREAIRQRGAAAARGQALFQLLFPPPARRAIAGAKRLVISPDGPLWELPFAALAVGGKGHRARGTGEGAASNVKRQVSRSRPV